MITDDKLGGFEVIDNANHEYYFKHSEVSYIEKVEYSSKEKPATRCMLTLKTGEGIYLEDPFVKVKNVLRGKRVSTDDYENELGKIRK